MASEFETSAKDAVRPVVAALDVGSTGTRGCLYDARGLPVRGTKLKLEHAFTTGADGRSTIDPDLVVEQLGTCLDHIVTSFDEQVDGVALDTFASSLVGVDAHDRAMTPCFTYADSRPADQVLHLRGLLDEDATQQRTGCRQHTSYLPARFLWLRQTDPTTFSTVQRWLSLGEYAWLRLIGSTAAGTSTAAWTGMMNRREGSWDAELCQLVGVDAARLSPIAEPAETLTGNQAAAKRWPQLAKARWFAPITDGFSSSIGVGIDDDSQVVLAAATSGALRVMVSDQLDHLPRGLWCNRIDATRSILGGALNDVGRAVSWLEATLKLPGAEELGRAMAAAPVDQTPLVLPFFSGERSTGWMGQARAEFHGISAATTPVELYRGTVEGIALSYERVLGQLRQVVGQPKEVLASGRVVQDHPELLQLFADVLGVPVTPVTIKRSTLHGTAVHALEVLAPAVERATPTRGTTLQPDRAAHLHHQRRAEAFQALYDQVVAQGRESRAQS